MDLSQKIEINLVDYLNIRVVEELLTKELTMAQDIGKGSYRETENARMHLERAKGMHTTLSLLQLLPTDIGGVMEEDIARIEQKITTTQKEKEAEAYARHMQRRS